MHWNNGKFHQNIIVGEKVYITDYKHTAISGDKDSIIFGSINPNTNIIGANISIDSLGSINMQSVNNITIKSLEAPVSLETIDKIELKGNKGIMIDKSNYGTTLPTTGNYEGRVFFKLIS